MQKSTIPFETIGIVYNARIKEAMAMTSTLVKQLDRGGKLWMCATHDVGQLLSQGTEADLIITVGGDGTILRAVRLAAPLGIPLLGINMGRLGFLTELKADQALERLPAYLDGEVWIEERAMLQAEVDSEGGHSQGPFPALNDVVVGRGAISRLVRVSVAIDTVHLTTYRADAVVVATATGSTGYNLSAGGPILHPQAKDMVLKPVAPHIGLTAALVFPSTSVIELTVESDRQGMFSVDGYLDLPLEAGATVKIKSSPLVANFLRAQPVTHFYSTLTQRLSMGDSPQTSRAFPLG